MACNAVHISTIVCFLLSCYIPITKSCRTRLMRTDRTACKSASNHMEFRVITGVDIVQEYFLRFPSEKIIFYVKAFTTAEIVLSDLPEDKPPLLKIIIGRNENSKSVIEEYYKDNIHSTPLITTPNILNEWQYRGFWISIHDDTVHVGKENEEEPFMSYTTINDNKMTYLLYISFRTPLETGEWIIGRGIIQGSLAGWCEQSRTINPRRNAVKVDVSEGKHIYICRSIIDGDLVPGYAKSPNGGCKIEHFGSFKSKHYELLVSGAILNWENIYRKSTPKNAVVGGLTDEQRPIYICRFKLNDKRMIIGNTRNDRRCWAASKGKIYHSHNYDILMRDIH